MLLGDLSGICVSSAPPFIHVAHHSDSAPRSYLSSVFVGCPVGIDQVGDVWVNDNDGAAPYMIRRADLMYDARPLSLLIGLRSFQGMV